MTDVPATLLVNGRVHSPSHPDATAMAVRGGVVLWLGSDDLGREQFAGADIVDLAGGFVAPAFVDSHIHLTATGLTLTGLDLRAATSLPHCLRLVADFARPTPARRSGDMVGMSRRGRRTPRRAPRISMPCSAIGLPTWPGSMCTRRWHLGVCGSALTD